MLAGLTVDSGSSGGSGRWGVWQSSQVAVTTRPLLIKPLPVDAHLVGVDDSLGVPLGPQSRGCSLALSVAFRAEVGHVPGIGR